MMMTNVVKDALLAVNLALEGAASLYALEHSLIVSAGSQLRLRTFHIK